jgi:DNA-binding NarL/FixJ family response regulator
MQQKNQIKTLLVEDHPIYREGLRLALSFSRDINCTVVSAVGCAKQATDYIESHPQEIDLIVLDFFLPDGNGRDVVKVAKTLCPQAKILVVSSATDMTEVKALQSEGVNGIVSKDVQSDEVAEIVRTVMQGRDCFGRSFASTADDDAPLTLREREIVRLLVNGKSAKQVADSLCISPKTVERHRENIYSKLGLESITDLMKYAIKKGLL